MEPKKPFLEKPWVITLLPVGVIFLVLGLSTLWAMWTGEGEIVWQKPTRPGTGSVRITFPAGIKRVSIEVHPTFKDALMILAPGEAGIQTFWARPESVTPVTTATTATTAPKNVPDSTPKKGGPADKAKGGGSTPPKDPPLPPWFACTQQEQRPKNWIATCRFDGATLTVERSQSDSRGEVWILPARKVPTLGAKPLNGLWWTTTTMATSDADAGRSTTVEECSGRQKDGRPSFDTDACVTIRDVFHDPTLQPTTSSARAIADTIERWESKAGGVVLSTMAMVVKAVLGVFSGALVWQFFTRYHKHARHVEAGRLYRLIRWPLQWAEVVFPAVAFTLTTASLIVAFRKPQGDTGELAFRESIGFALVATALGLAIRVLAHSADRLLENAAHYGADLDGIVKPTESDDNADGKKPPEKGESAKQDGGDPKAGV